MKRTVLTILSMAITVIALSQSDAEPVNNQGAITYEEVIKFDIKLDNMTPEMQEMFPKENRSSMSLFFNEDYSRYENADVSEDDAFEHESEGGAIKIMISQPQNIVFRDLKNNMLVEQKDFMTRIFLIKSEMPEDEWKFTGKQKMILGYPCQEATKQDGENSISVWFTSAIPVSSGPGLFGNLPGMVLSVVANDGDLTITAQLIDLGEVDSKKLEKPKKGKKVSKEEFLAIVEEKNKEMGSEGGEGKTMIMTIQR